MPDVEKCVRRAHSNKNNLPLDVQYNIWVDIMMYAKHIYGLLWQALTTVLTGQFMALQECIIIWVENVLSEGQIYIVVDQVDWLIDSFYI